MTRTFYVVEWFEPSHGPNGIWYLHDKFDELAEANARMKTLKHRLNEDLVNKGIRVRRVVGKPAATTPQN